MLTLSCLAAFVFCVALLPLRTEAFVEDSALISSAVAECCPSEQRSCCRRALETDRPLKCGFNQSTAINVTSCLEVELWGPIEFIHKLANCCVLLPNWNKCRLSCFNKYNSPSIEQFDKLRYIEDCPRRDEETENEYKCYAVCAHKTANKQQFNETLECHFPDNRSVLLGEEIGKRI